MQTIFVPGLDWNLQDAFCLQKGGRNIWSLGRKDVARYLCVFGAIYELNYQVNCCLT